MAKKKAATKKVVSKKKAVKKANPEVRVLKDRIAALQVRLKALEG